MAKKEEKTWAMIGSWAFMAGLVIAVLTVLYSPIPNSTVLFLLGVLGVIVGILNITDKEVTKFLIAAIAFVTAANGLANVLYVVPGIGTYFPTILAHLVVFVAPAAAVVALKALYEVSRDE